MNNDSRLNSEDVYNNIKFDYSDSTYGSEYVDCYKQARDIFLSSQYSDFPDICFKSLCITFSISNKAKNTVLLYTILEKIPDRFKEIDKSNIRIIISSEDDFWDNIKYIFDLLSIISSWKSLVVDFNSVVLKPTTEFKYLLNYFEDKSGRKLNVWYKNIDALKKEYSSKRRSAIKKEKIVPYIISRDDPPAALRTVLSAYISLYCQGMEVEQYQINDKEIVIKINDSLIVFFRLIPNYWARLDNIEFKDWENPYVVMQELSYNNLFKFNFSGFRRIFKSNLVGMDYLWFHGLNYYNELMDRFDYVDKLYPDLKLKKRYEDYPGELNHLILLRMENPDGVYKYGFAYTKGKVHSFILKLCKELEEKNSRSVEIYGISCLEWDYNVVFLKAFLAWKGEKKRWRLENKFSYYFEDKYIKNDTELFTIPYDIIDSANAGYYNECEFGSYTKPLNKWKSEELVYNITKKIFKDYKVEYQYKPYYLSTETGNMSYDVFICGLNVAIEYQGKQHFEPVEYFGGKDSFEKQKYRDELKAELSKKNGVHLIYINYWESITPELIKSRVEKSLEEEGE